MNNPVFNTDRVRNLNTGFESLAKLMTAHIRHQKCCPATWSETTI